MNPTTKQKLTQAIVDAASIFSNLNILGGQAKQGATILAIFDAILKELNKEEDNGPTNT